MESRVPVPKVVEPSANVTVPVGVAVPEAGATVDVNVMLVPLTAVEAEEERFVVVPIGTVTPLTVILTAEDVLPLKFVSPA